MVISPMPPKYATFTTVLYTVAYFLLRDEGVNDGLSDYKPGINVKDKVALVEEYWF